MLGTKSIATLNYSHLSFNNLDLELHSGITLSLLITASQLNTNTIYEIGIPACPRTVPLIAFIRDDKSAINRKTQLLTVKKNPRKTIIE